MPENDIKFGGFLSYRHLRIIGWACLVIAQIGVVLNLEAKLAPGTAEAVDIWNMIISIFAGLPVPLFLLANLSVILQKRGDFKSLFIKFGGMAAGMYLLANIIVFHYGFRTMLALDPSTTWADTAELFGTLLPLFGKTGYTLNIFIDLLLVVCMFFFANYAPRAKIFQGKKIILFRLLILLPIAYEIFGVIAKYNITMLHWTLWSPVFFLLPSKPPLIIAAFVVILLCLKLAEFFYLRRPGNTPEKYERHIKTKAHALKISILIATVCVVTAIVDFAVMIGLMIFAMGDISAANPGITQDELSALVTARVEIYSSIGFGAATGLIFVAPLVLFFSYTKQHKNAKIDLIIPVVGVALVVFVLVEGIFQVLTLNLPVFLEKIKEWINNLFGGGGENPPASSALGLGSLLTNIVL